jgi:hypothetical protein
MFKFLTKFKKCPPYWFHDWHSVGYANRIPEKLHKGCGATSLYRTGIEYQCSRCRVITFGCKSGNVYMDKKR